MNAANEHSIDDEAPTGYSLMKQLLERDNYKTRTIDFKPTAAEARQAARHRPDARRPPPSKSPRTAWCWSSAARNSLIRNPSSTPFKKYVEGGGHALFMLDNVLKIGRGEPTAENTELVNVLTDWGVTPQ